MTLKLTERDKKLLVVLAVVVLVAGLGGRVILPLLDKMTETGIELDEERIKKSENEVKVNALAELEKASDSLDDQIDEAKERYNGELLSKDVDRMLTEAALSHGATITGLSITMPEKGEQTILAPYVGIRAAETDAQESEETDTAEAIEEAAAEVSYTGFSTAQALLRLSGDRAVLQSVLDDLSGRTPQMRVSAFRWEESGGETALSINLEIYMMRDIDAYSKQQQEDK